MRLEALETRANPAIFIVTAITDVANPADDDTVFTLREAITAANENPGPDVINFAAGLKNQTITLDHSEHLPWYGPTALPAIESEIAINGNGVRIVRNEAGPVFRFFYISGGRNSHPDAGNLTLTNLSFTDGEIRGGNGANGGGGAAGMGGAIYNQGTLTLNGVTLESNNAVGGNGALYTSGDGGGGGLGGDGNTGGFGGQGNPDFIVGYGGSFGEAGSFGGGGGSGVDQDGFKGGQGGFGGGNGAGSQVSPAFGGGGNSLSRGGGGAGLGGAIFNHGGTLTIINSTLVGNTASGGTGFAAGIGLGGAIFNLNGTVLLTNATLAFNRADQGGNQIWSLGSDDKSNNGFDDTDPVPGTAAIVTSSNSILWQNTNTQADFTTGIVGTATSTSAGVGNIIGRVGNFAGTVVTSADPLLSPTTAANGGFTRTLKLLPNSPAINRGVNAAVPNQVVTDQRGVGFPRVLDNVVDIGAFEFGEPDDVTGDGLVDIRDIIFQVYVFNTFAQNGPAAVNNLPPELRIGDVTRDGLFDIRDILRVIFKFGLIGGNGEGEGAEDGERVREGEAEGEGVVPVASLDWLADATTTRRRRG